MKLVIISREIVWIMKQFCKNNKPLFSDRSLQKITPVEVDKIFTRDAKYVELLNAFLLNLVKLRSFSEKVIHLILKAIFKYSKNPSIIAINNATNVWPFQFSCWC